MSSSSDVLSDALSAETPSNSIESPAPKPEIAPPYEWDKTTDPALAPLKAMFSSNAPWKMREPPLATIARPDPDTASSTISDPLTASSAPPFSIVVPVFRMRALSLRVASITPPDCCWIFAEITPAPEIVLATLLKPPTTCVDALSLRTIVPVPLSVAPSSSVAALAAPTRMLPLLTTDPVSASIIPSST